MDERHKLRFRCRRGLKELDVLLELYLAQHYDRAEPAQQAAFRFLLEQEDPLLLAWVLGQAPPPSEFADVVERLRRHA